jgi:hypothetical protein
VFVVRFIAGKFENIIIFKCLHLFEEWGGLRVVFAFCHSSNCSFLNYAYNAAYQWGPLWANKKVYVHCDNQTAVAIINKESCNNPFVSESLRQVFWLSIYFNFRIKAVYYKGSSKLYLLIEHLDYMNIRVWKNCVTLLTNCFLSINYRCPFGDWKSNAYMKYI